MHQYPKYFFFIIILLAAAACKEKDSVTEPTVNKKEILTSSNWQIASDSQTGEKGAKMKFRTDGKVEASYGGTTIVSDWSLNSNETELKISASVLGMKIEMLYKFITCTKEQIVLEIISEGEEDKGKNLKLIKTT